jgi:hypothetical protein
VFKLAELFVQISADDRSLRASLARANALLIGTSAKLASTAAGLGGSAIAGLDQLQAKIGGIVTKLGAISALGGGALFYKAIQGASDLAETVDFAKIVFGDSIGAMTDYVDELAGKFGIVKKEALDVATGFAGLGKGIAGLKGDNLIAFSKTLTQMSLDLSSAKNMKFDEAAKQIQMQLSGAAQSDSLRAMGVITTEAAMAQYMLDNNIRGTVASMSEQSKMAVRLMMITEGLKDTQGNLGDTIDSTANQQRKATGDLQNSLATFGAAVVPIWTAVLDAASSALSGINGWLNASKDGITTWATTIGEYVGGIGVLFRNWGLTIEMVGLTFQEKILNMQEIVAWFVGSASQYVEAYASNWTAAITDAMNFTWAIFSNTFTNIKDLVKATWAYISSPGSEFNFKPTELTKGYESALSELPDIAKPHLTSLQAQIDELGTKMGDAEINRVNSAVKQADTAAKSGTEVAQEILTNDQGSTAPGKAKDKKEELKTLGLEEFAKSLQAGVFGDKTAQEALVAQQATAKGIKQLVQQGAPPALAGV